jgi:hypothetical protein
MPDPDPKDLNHATESEKMLAVALIGLAGAIFAGLLSVVINISSGLIDSGAWYAIVVSVVIFVLLGLSIVLGGRGCVYGPGRDDWRDRFNLQAIFGAISIILIVVLAFIIRATTEPSATEKFAAKQTELETRLVDVKKDVDAVSRDIASLKNDVAGLKNGLVDLTNKEGANEKSLINLDRASTNYSSKLSEIDNSLKSLSDRTEKLEQGTSQVKP